MHWITVYHDIGSANSSTDDSSEISEDDTKTEEFPVKIPKEKNRIIHGYEEFKVRFVVIVIEPISNVHFWHYNCDTLGY